MSGGWTRALVLDDQPDARAWLAAALAACCPDVPVDEAATLEAGRAWLRGWLARGAAGRAVALVDIGLPDGSGLDLIREIRRRGAAVMPVVTTIYEDDAHLFGAMAAGAEGYLLKDQDEAGLVAALRRMEAGIPPLSPSIARRILAHFRERPVPAAPEGALTQRESEVLGLIGRGMRSAEVARSLGLAEHTVTGYIKTIYRKLDIGSRAEAAIEAARRGLL